MAPARKLAIVTCVAFSLTVMFGTLASMSKSDRPQLQTQKNMATMATMVITCLTTINIDSTCQAFTCILGNCCQECKPPSVRTEDGQCGVCEIGYKLSGVQVDRGVVSGAHICSTDGLCLGVAKHSNGNYYLLEAGSSIAKVNSEWVPPKKKMHSPFARLMACVWVWRNTVTVTIYYLLEAGSSIAKVNSEWVQQVWKKETITANAITFGSIAFTALTALCLIPCVCFSCFLSGWFALPRASVSNSCIVALSWDYDITGGDQEWFQSVCVAQAVMDKLSLALGFLLTIVAIHTASAAVPIWVLFVALPFVLFSLRVQFRLMRT